MAALSQAKQQAAVEAAKANMTGEKPSFILFMIVGMIALLKDLLDLVFIGSLPGIGTVITMCFTFLIWVLLAVFDRSGGRYNMKIMRGVVLMFVAIVEGLGFGLNFLPIQTITIVLLYLAARKAYKKAKKEADSSFAYA